MTIQAIKDKLPELQARLGRMEVRLGGLRLKREKAERAFNLLKNKEVIMLERMEKMRAKISKFQKIKNFADREGL